MLEAIKFRLGSMRLTPPLLAPYAGGKPSFRRNRRSDLNHETFTGHMSAVNVIKHVVEGSKEDLNSDNWRRSGEALR